MQLGQGTWCLHVRIAEEKPHGFWTQRTPTGPCCLEKKSDTISSYFICLLSHTVQKHGRREGPRVSRCTLQLLRTSCSIFLQWRRLSPRRGRGRANALTALPGQARPGRQSHNRPCCDSRRALMGPGALTTLNQEKAAHLSCWSQDRVRQTPWQETWRT